ncbi:hypothetical protein N7G274_005276 [Stereocaulon virgatum]|uniref:Uncharacterized protein n=1 Tax=Stereocaulon virgatum TaxID=373712 RepID=A0ABR4A8R7_9LECA
MEAVGPTGQSQMIFDLEYPTVVAQREPFDLNLILKSSPSLDLFLHSWTANLVENTCASVSDSLKENWMAEHTLGSEVHINDFKARPLINPSPKTALEYLTVPATCAASFATPNLQRTYSLRVIVMLQCGGQSQELLYNTGNVALLGAEFGSKGIEREDDEVYNPDMDGPREMFQGRLAPSLYVRNYRA